MLIDAHCHFNSLNKSKREEISSLAGENIFIDSSIDLGSSLSSVSLSRQSEFLYTSLGFHPFSAAQFSSGLVQRYRELIEQEPKIIAVGEVGLDYKASVLLDQQKEILSTFLQLAKDKGLAVVIHNRLDTDEILEILDIFFADYSKVVFHCFSYSKDFLEKILKKNGFVSFSLNILRKNTQILSSLKSCPLENLLLETDSPYMRIAGSSSTPLDIAKVYSFVSIIKEVGQNELEKAVFSNAKRVFSL